MWLAMARGMKTFKTSFTARLLWSTIALFFLGGGAIALLGIAPGVAPGALFIVVGALSIFALSQGIYDHPAEVALTALLLPLGYWPSVMVVLHAANNPQFGWGLVAFGFVPLAMMLAATAAKKRESLSPARVATHA
jgi:hypothetical protein